MRKNTSKKSKPSKPSSGIVIYLGRGLRVKALPEFVTAAAAGVPCKTCGRATSGTDYAAAGKAFARWLDANAVGEFTLAVYDEMADTYEGTQGSGD